MELFISSLLPPYLIFKGQVLGDLVYQWDQYGGPAKVMFQPSHVMDDEAMRFFLDWLMSLYPPDKRIFLTATVFLMVELADVGVGVGVGVDVDVDVGVGVGVE